jgi:SP family general alpha glucoside:H+ symporter-like MFS transporter
MGNPVETKAEGGQEVEHAYDVEDKTFAAEDKAANAQKQDAIEAENAEHNMGVLEAVRAYPMASLWAFIMSCTIVSYTLPHSP